MTFTVFNTLTRRKEEFVPLNPDNVRMYVCGPTVYDRAHIGNARPIIVFDTLYRLLKQLYPKVTYVRNITDVDDKIIKKSQESGEPISVIAEHSRCQPGRPRPHGLSQPGWVSSDGFHKMKSAASRLYGATSTRAPAIISSIERCDRQP